ncbi:MFS transporter [Kitasatospora xanthocidica]|uniref:MFS transporter n=1 Tax=Kitasatospora xanthocidica TaxID=83382 RepID=UPI0016786FE5|nr:MFS transporter [Kitasatospora xanthocidica]
MSDRAPERAGQAGHLGRAEHPGDPGPEAAASLYARPYAAATAGFAAVMFLTGFAALAVVPTLPAAVSDLDGVALYPLVAGCFTAASLFGGVLGGSWADRAGARRPLVAGILLGVATLVVSGTSTTVWQLAAGRFLDGIAAGMTAVAITTAIARAYPGRLRAHALSLMSTCWIVPSLVGPPLAGLVAGWWSWRAVFLGLAAITVLPIVAVLPLLRRPGAAGAEGAEGAEGLAETAARPPLAVAAAVSGGAALAQYGVSGWDPGRLAAALVGLGLLGAFAPRLLPGGTGRAARGLPATVLLRGLSSGAYFTLEAFVPLLLDTVREVPAAVTGLAFTGAAVVWAAANWVQGHLLEHRARHRVLAGGMGVCVLAVLIAGVGTLPGSPAVTAGAALVVAAAGMGVAAPSMTLLSIAHSPPGRQGRTGGEMQTAQNLGQVVVMGVSSALFNLCLAGGGGGSGGAGAYTAVFALLLVPCVLVVGLAGRAGAGSGSD